jgi:hypothetical protein
MTLIARWHAISARERRTVMAAGAAVAIGLLFARGVPAWSEWTQRTRMRDIALEDSLRGMQRLVEALPPAHVATPARLSRRDSESRFRPLVATAVTGAQAALMRLTTAAADDVGLVVESLQPMQEPIMASNARGARRPDLSRISVHASGAADTDEFVEFLAFVDSSVVPLSIRGLTVTRGSGSLSGSSALRFELTLSTLAKLPPARAR